MDVFHEIFMFKYTIQLVYDYAVLLSISTFFYILRKK